jgi:L-threonylcarbamoyladenylate synthase
MIGTDITLAAKYLSEGMTVGIPTETVYGLAANALDEDAVLSVFKIKNRPFFDPLIVHVSSIESVRKFTEEFPEKAMKLAQKFWPGPLTLLLKKNDKIPYIITSGSDKVAIRIPDNPLTLALLNQLPFPLAAPSANPFGYISPTRAEHVQDQLGKSVPYILDGGVSGVGLESTIIDCTSEHLTVLRLGGLSVLAIEECLGEKLLVNIAANSNPEAPGQLDKHYAPDTKFVLSDNIDKTILKNKGRKIAALIFGQVKVPESIYHLNLSEKASIDEAAHNLFHYMRQLDALKFDIIVAMKLPETGLGMAINDRLARASVK